MRRTADEVIQNASREARLEKELKRLRTENGTLRASLANINERVGLLEKFGTGAQVIQPPWTSPKKRTGLHHATPGLLLSDLHFDEHVYPEQVEGLNGYNREIAELRLHECFSRTVMLAREYLSGVTYDGFTLLLGGDMFSGDIHEELAETNEDTIIGSVLHWLEELHGFVGGLADEFGKVHIAGVAGNHGRLTRKPRAKFYARENFDWLLYNLLRRDFRKDARITWNIPESRDADIHIYTTRVKLTHGDQAKGGSGIQGKRAPLSLLEHRKAKRALVTGQTFHVMMYGHWHEYDPGERLYGNGSLKGIDEFSLGHEFGCEEPKQGFFMTTPERGITVKAPIFCSAGRKKEKW